MSIIHTVISWLYSHGWEDFFSPRAGIHLSEPVPWQLKGDEENLALSCLFFLTLSYFKLSIALA